MWASDDGSSEPLNAEAVLQHFWAGFYQRAGYDSTHRCTDKLTFGGHSWNVLGWCDCAAAMKITAMVFLEHLRLCFVLAYRHSPMVSLGQSIAGGV